MAPLHGPTFLPSQANGEEMMKRDKRVVAMAEDAKANPPCEDPHFADKSWDEEAIEQLEQLQMPVFARQDSSIPLLLVYTCVSSRHSQKCVTLLKLITKLIFFYFKVLEHLFLDIFS